MNQLNQWIKRFINGDSTNLKYYIGIGVCCVFAVGNYLRVRSSRCKDRSIVVEAKTKKNVAIVFLPGTAQNAKSCVGRMKILADEGYDCHALNLTQSGSFFTSYASQMKAIREYVSALNKPFVMVGHSQGGSKVQMYVLDKHASTSTMPRGIILLASSDLDVFSAVPKINFYVMQHRPLSCLLSSMSGMLFGEMTSFTFGGGPFRHIFGMYRGMFYTKTTTLLGDGPVSLRHFADVAIDSHDPMITDLMTFRTSSTPKEVLDNGLEILHLVAAKDHVVPFSQSKAISNRWGGVKPIVIPKQGHEMGDLGWESTVMGEILKFMEKFDDE